MEAPNHTNKISHFTGWFEWYTPKYIIESARKAMGSIDLDPASNNVANKVVKAETFYNKEQNGLRFKWHGNVWMNPPYKNSLLEEFTLKLLEAYQIGEVKQAIVLTNNATETEWFQLLAGWASAVCFPAKRISFWNLLPVESHPVQGQVICYIGKNPDAFEREFKQYGIILRN